MITAAEDMLIDLGAMDELKDKFSWLEENMETKTLKLQSYDHYTESARDLFRAFHSIKAISNYLKLKHVTATFHAIEEVLAILLHKKPPANQEIVDWLLLINDQLIEWHQQIERYDYRLQPIDAYTLSMIKTAVPTTSRGLDILKNQTLFFIVDDSPIQAAIESALGKNTQKVVFATSLDSALSEIKACQPQMIGCNAYFQGQNSCADLIKIYQALEEFIPVIVFENKILGEKEKNDFRKASFEHFISKPITREAITNKFSSMAKVHYGEKSIKFSRSSLVKKIESFKPLPKVMTELRQFMTDENASLQKLSSIITQDSALCAKILKMINSPGFGMRQEIASIHHAITLLGKEKVVAIAFQTNFADERAPFKLTPYGLSEEDFYHISNRRMNLMLHWYSKVSMAEIGILTTAALLGNIGQVVIADELERLGKTEQFREFIQNVGVTVGELEFLHTTTEDITYEILAHWGLADSLLDTIRFSFDLANTDTEIRPLALAAHVVFNTIPIDGSPIDYNHVDTMAELITEMNMNSAPYLKAVEKVK